MLCICCLSRDVLSVFFTRDTHLGLWVTCHMYLFVRRTEERILFLLSHRNFLSESTPLNFVRYSFVLIVYMCNTLEHNPIIVLLFKSRTLWTGHELLSTCASRHYTLIFRGIYVKSLDNVSGRCIRIGQNLPFSKITECKIY